MTIEELYTIIQTRKKVLPANSYVSSLFKQGTNAISQKVGEEAVEVVIAATSENKKRVVEETADLWFHTLMLLANCNISVSEILQELEKRHAA